MLDPANGPLIAVRLNILTRKTLGGLQTDLDSRVLDADGQPIEGLYAAGEVAGFGGGGMHGYARARRHVSRRLHFLRPQRRPGGGRFGEVTTDNRADGRNPPFSGCFSRKKVASVS